MNFRSQPTTSLELTDFVEIDFDKDVIMDNGSSYFRIVAWLIEDILSRLYIYTAELR
jgi:hypothetical protein